MVNKKNEINYIKEKVIGGISLLLLREIFLKGVSIVGQLLLVRIIAPEFFGLYAIISFVISIATYFTDFGISTAIVQSKKKLTSYQITTLLIFLEILGFLAVIGIFLLSPLIKDFYPALKNQDAYLLTLLSLTLILIPPQTILISLMDKDLEYESIAKIDSIGIIVYYLVAIILAFNSFNIYSFIYAVLIKEICELFASLYYKRIKFHFSINFNEIKDILKYGFTIQIGSGVLLLHNSLVPLIGGTLFNASYVGYLDWSKNISSLPNSLLDNYGRAAFAGISLIQDKHDLISKAINKSINFLNIAIFFFATIVFSFLNDFINFIATSKWLPAMTVLQFFILGSLFSGVITVLGQGLVAIGKAKELAFLSFILVIMEIIIALFFALYFGFVGLAISYFLHAVLQFIFYTYLAKKNKISLSYLRSFLNGILIFIFCILFSFFLNNILPFSFVSYIFKIFILSFIYIAIYYILSKEEMLELLNLIWGIIKNYGN